MSLNRETILATVEAHADELQCLGVVYLDGAWEPPLLMSAAGREP